MLQFYQVRPGADRKTPSGLAGAALFKLFPASARARGILQRFPEVGDLAVVRKRRIQINPVPAVTDKTTDFMKKIGVVPKLISGLEFDNAPLI
ncbi:MAG: hypothetical protein RLZ25_1036 [Pseudomonadota bacterium]